MVRVTIGGWALKKSRRCGYWFLNGTGMFWERMVQVAEKKFVWMIGDFGRLVRG